MFRAALGLVGLLGTLAAVPPASAEGNSDYSVLIISGNAGSGHQLRDRHLPQRPALRASVPEQSTSFNLPPGPVDVRLRLLPGQVPGCAPGIEDQRSTRLSLQAGQISKYRIAMGANGLQLKRAGLGY